MLLTACSSTPVIQTKIVKQYPPDALIQTIPHPEISTATNGELLEAVASYAGALEEANINFLKIQERKKDAE